MPKKSIGAALNPRKIQKFKKSYFKIRNFNIGFLEFQIMISSVSKYSMIFRIGPSTCTR